MGLQFGVCTKIFFFKFAFTRVDVCVFFFQFFYGEKEQKRDQTINLLSSINFYETDEEEKTCTYRLRWTEIESE